VGTDSKGDVEDDPAAAGSFGYWSSELDDSESLPFPVSAGANRVTDFLLSVAARLAAFGIRAYWAVFPVLGSAADAIATGLQGTFETLALSLTG
jgi:hypothetical protein